MSRHAVIMAGGSGTRLWPISRQSTPKQFQKLIGDKTLLQQTFERLGAIFKPENIWVVVKMQHRDIVAEQLPSLPVGNIISELAGRNTAAATILATLTILEKDPDALLFGLVPADHYIGKPKIFAQTAKAALDFLEKNPRYVATIGVHPSEPNTGLGYIKVGERLDKVGGKVIANVDSFHEKPDLETAEKFVESGRYLWNGGYYLFNAQVMVGYFEQLAPKIIGAVRRYRQSPSEQAYNQVPSQSVDTAIAEKLDQMVVVAAEMEWSDIGNWAVLHEILTATGKTAQVATELHISDNSENTLVLGGSKLIATVGLKDVVVIDTDDVILICDKGSVQDVKKIVEQLQEQGRDHLL